MARCKYPGCAESDHKNGLCRRHDDAAARSEAARKASARDKSPPWEWQALSLLDVEGCGGLTRLCISRDPLRRREEMQAGCPWALRLDAIVFAPRPALDFVAAQLGRVFDQFSGDGLRPGWWAVAAAVVQDEAVEIAERHAADLPTGLVHPSRLRSRRYDLSDPDQYRLNRLLDLLSEAGH